MHLVWLRLRPNKEFVEPQGVTPILINMSHDRCAQCLPPSHFVMPQDSNQCASCQNFNESSYRSRIQERQQAGLPPSPGSKASPPLDDIESVASLETSDGSHGGSRPRFREASTSRDADPLLHTSTHSGGYGQEEVPEASRKRKESLGPLLPPHDRFDPDPLTVLGSLRRGAVRIAGFNTG